MPPALEFDAVSWGDRIRPPVNSTVPPGRVIGVLGFIGLIIPNIVRLLVGGDAARVVSITVLSGATVLIGTDIAACTLMLPEDVPVGIITGLVGGVFFSGC